MYDKTIFEAMACGCITLASNENLRGLIEDDYIFDRNDLDDLSNKLSKLVTLDDERCKILSKKMRNIVIENHSLSSLSDKIFKSIS
jgi:glycosyltransferase involved in cell wall biosynthesis